MSRQPIGPIITQPAVPKVGVTNFQYVAMPGSSTFNIIIELPLGGELLMTNIEGTYTSYSVVVVDQDGYETIQKVGYIFSITFFFFFFSSSSYFSSFYFSPSSSSPSFFFFFFFIFFLFLPSFFPSFLLCLLLFVFLFLLLLFLFFFLFFFNVRVEIHKP